MKFFTKILILAAVIILAVYLKHHFYDSTVASPTPSTVEHDTASPTLSTQDTALRTVVQPIEEKFSIKNAEDLRKLLVGKWDYQMDNKSEIVKQYDTGHIEFNKDGSFTKFLTISIYVSNTTDPVDLVYGGSIRGKWSVVDSSAWRETAIECSIRNSYNDSTGAWKKEIANAEINPCGIYNKRLYGTISLHNINTEIKEISETEILITGSDFNSGAALSYRYHKVSK